VTDDELDAALEQAAHAPHDVDPALLGRITGSIGASLRPVHPLPSLRVLVGGSIIVCVAVAVAGAARSGFYGIHRLSAIELASILPVLGILIWLAAAGFVAEMMPGSFRRMSPGVLLASGSVALLAVFGILFHDYGTERFLSQGMICLGAGLLHAVPVGFASWLLLRRGFAVNPVSAGLSAGTLAGLAGVTMLELHCANLEVFHVMLWHTAVMLLSGLAGASLVWIWRRRSSSI
jgi:hypothetical protein